MTRNIKLTIAYDGTNYKGWQDNNSEQTIEGLLKLTLSRILQEQCKLQAASRTDAGVHANGQIVNFLCHSGRSTTDIIKGLNSLLPLDIRCLACEEAPQNFHPTLDNIGKEYHYHICNLPVQYPCYRFYSWHCPLQLNVTDMIKASEHLIGTHNFRSFCNYRKDLGNDFVRTLYKLELIELKEQRLRIEVAGHNFLYRMARNIVGTLVYVGLGKITADDIPKIILSQQRSLSGITAPAHGLALHRVYY